MDLDSSEYSSSSSDDDSLDDVDFIPRHRSTERSDSSSGTPDTKHKETKKDRGDVSIGSKLEALLSNQRDETIRDLNHQKLKTELLHSIEQGSQEETGLLSDESLNEEQAEHIKNLEVSVPTSLVVHPTVAVFRPASFACVFKETIRPFTGGVSPIDRLLATIRPEGLYSLLLSNTLPSCILQVTNPDALMMWLLSILSVHSSSVVLDLCSRNLATLLRLQTGPPPSPPRTAAADQLTSKRRLGWSPTPIQLVRILVNLGADPVYLLGDQCLYTQEEVREHLSVENDGNNSMPTKPTGKVRLENCRHLFEILTKCFQTKPDCTKEELNLMMGLVMKVSLDTLFQHMDLKRQFQTCLSAILECYKESDWPSVAACLCRQLSVIPQHHHSAVYLASLVPLSARGNYLQVRLSFLLLCLVLEPQRRDELLAVSLDKVSPLTIARLGCESGEESDSFRFASCLGHLIQEDVYKVDSTLVLLDRALGDELNRSQQPKEELHFLTNQVKMVIRDIRDSINSLELSKMKDKMTVMTVKWMTLSTPQTMSVQRSLFHWATSSSPTTLKEVKLKATNTGSDDKEEEEEEMIDT